MTYNHNPLWTVIQTPVPSIDIWDYIWISPYGDGSACEYGDGLGNSSEPAGYYDMADQDCGAGNGWGCGSSMGFSCGDGASDDELQIEDLDQDQVLVYGVWHVPDSR